MKLLRLTTIKSSALRPIRRVAWMVFIFTVPQWGIWLVAKAIGEPSFPNGYPIFLPLLGTLGFALCIGVYLYAYLYLRKHHPNMVKPETTTRDLFVTDEDHTKVH